MRNGGVQTDHSSRGGEWRARVVANGMENKGSNLITELSELRPLLTAMGINGGVYPDLAKMVITNKHFDG